MLYKHSYLSNYFYTFSEHYLQVKRADPVLPNDEQALWDSGVFNIDLSTGLSYIVFFYNCKMVGFRALDEHTQLDASQFSISVVTNGNKELHYTGRLCKKVG